MNTQNPENSYSDIPCLYILTYTPTAHSPLHCDQSRIELMSVVTTTD
jgi:hypothetical protein